MSSLLVPIVTIKNLQPIKGADRIVLAQFHEVDWQVVVGKDEFEVGSKVVYFPPETVLPEAMVQKYGLTHIKNGRIRSIRLKGVYSHGLALPVPAGINPVPHTNMAEYFGVTKYETPIAANKRDAMRRGGSQVSWPIYVQRYTDIENANNYKCIFMPGMQVIVTEKVHGMNFQAGWVRREKVSWIRKIFARWLPELEYEFLVFSRKAAYTLNTENTWTKIAKKYDLPNKMRGYWNILVCGEVYGKNIQDLEYGLNDVRLIVFDFQNVGAGGNPFFNWAAVELFAKELNLDAVPVLFQGEYDDALIKAMVSGKTSVGFNYDQMREGIVIRPETEGYDGRVGRVILKLISPEYLSRKEGTEFQ